jgi:hypothetical protein
MTGANQQISFERCPLCCEPHTYALAVERSAVIRFMGVTTPLDQPLSRHFRRLFTCPNKDEIFEATITLLEWSSDPIREVSIVGQALPDQ